MIPKNTVPIITYNGDDVTLGPYAVPFPTYEIESLLIYVTLLADGTETALVEGVDFNIANIGVNGIDATVTLINSGQAWIDGGGGGLDITYSLTIEFDSDSFQPGSFRSFNNTSPLTLEQSLDRITMSAKSMANRLDTFDNGQVATNTADIAQLQVDLASTDADVALLDGRISSIEDELLTNPQVINDGVANVDLTNAVIDNVFDEHMLLEYVILRNGSVQYGRQLIVGPTIYNISPIEKVGNAGISFTIANAGGVGTVRYTSTSTGFAGTINYSLRKFNV